MKKVTCILGVTAVDSEIVEKAPSEEFNGMIKEYFSKTTRDIGGGAALARARPGASAGVPRRYFATITIEENGATLYIRPWIFRSALGLKSLGGGRFVSATRNQDFPCGGCGRVASTK